MDHAKLIEGEVRKYYSKKPVIIIDEHFHTNSALKDLLLKKEYNVEFFGKWNKLSYNNV